MSNNQHHNDLNDLLKNTGNRYVKNDHFSGSAPSAGDDPYLTRKDMTHIPSSIGMDMPDAPQPFEQEIPFDPPVDPVVPKKRGILLPILLGVAGLMALLAILLLKGCEPQKQPGSSGGSLSDLFQTEPTTPRIDASISLSSVTTVIVPREVRILTPSTTPDGLQVVWSTSDPEVVTVEEGRIVGVAPGDATITASIEYDGAAHQAQCQVTVVKAGITLSSTSTTMAVAEHRILTPTTSPANQTITWSTSDPEVVTVEEGRIVGIAPGEATVTARFEFKGDIHEASCTVTVTKPGVTLSSGNTSMAPGESRILTPTTRPANLEVTWSSSDPAIATIDNGRITGIAPGKATITAAVEYKGTTYTSRCEVTITEPGVSLSSGTVSMSSGESRILTPTTRPANLDVTWSTSDPGVVTVDGGRITGIAPGNATVTVIMEYQGKTYKSACEVTVTRPGVFLSSNTTTMAMGESRILTPTTRPANLEVSWSTSDPGVVTVDGGRITGIFPGKATITAVVEYKGKLYTSNCEVTVTEPTLSVGGGVSTLTYSPWENDSCTLTASAAPEGGSFTWSSSDPSVATVSGSGSTATVTAVSNGSATITATYSISGRTVTNNYPLSVEKAASKLRIDNFSYSPSGTIDSFWVTGTITSNYPLVRVENIGTATSNALNITVGGDTTEPYYFAEDTYSIDASILCSYFIEQYRSLYNAYAAIAGLFGADDSVTMNVNITCYDASGYSESRMMTFVVYQN